MSQRRQRRRPVPKVRGLSVAVGRRIRELREARAMTQTELGEPYLTRAGVSTIERGVVTPSLHVLAFFARKMRLSLSALLPRSAAIHTRPTAADRQRRGGARAGGRS